MNLTPTLVAIDARDDFVSTHCLTDFDTMAHSDLVELAWDHVAVTHAEGGPWFRPVPFGQGDRNVFFVRQYAVSLDDTVAAMAAKTAGIPLVSMRRALFTVAPETAAERAYFAVLRPHWVSVFRDAGLLHLDTDVIAGMVARNRGAGPDATPCPDFGPAFADYGIATGGREIVNLDGVCRVEGQFTSHVVTGGLSIAARIVAAILAQPIAPELETVI